MTDYLKPNTPAWNKRHAIHRHNGCLGHAAMIRTHAIQIIYTPTTTEEAKKIARLIHVMTWQLSVELKKREGV